MRRRGYVFAGLGLALLLSLVAAVSAGTEAMAPRHVLDLLASPVARAADPTGALILWDIRLPRVLAAALAGGCLSVAGVALQSLLQNPLADPFVLGVSAGASAGAALVIALGLAMALGGLMVPFAALLGALTATVLVFGLAQSRGRLPGTVLLLSGVVVASILGSLISLLLFLSDTPNKMQAIIVWTMGGFGEADWTRVAVLTIPALVGAVALWALGRDLDLMAFGEDPARFLGADIERVKRLILFLTAMLTACAVAVGGVIGFVGLIVPHAMRRLVGPGHRTLIAAAALGGATFLVLADLLARTVRPPTEIPVGLLTGLLGGPFFLALLRTIRTAK